VGISEEKDVNKRFREMMDAWLHLSKAGYHLLHTLKLDAKSEEEEEQQKLWHICSEIHDIKEQLSLVIDEVSRKLGE